VTVGADVDVVVEVGVVLVGIDEAVAEGSAVVVGDAEGVGVNVRLAVAVGEGDVVLVGVAVADGVGVAESVPVTVAVGEGVGLGVAVPSHAANGFSTDHSGPGGDPAVVRRALLGPPPNPDVS